MTERSRVEAEIRRRRNSALLSPRNRAIVRRLADGASMRAVAKEFGITRQRVSQISFRVTGKLTQPPLDWTQERLGVLRSLWGKGLGVSAIAGRLGVSEASISKKARHLGLPPHPPLWTEDRIAMLRQLRSQGMRGGELAQRLGMPVGVVNSKIWRLKLSPQRIAWTEDRIALLRLLHGQGLEGGEIAQRLGLPRGCVYSAAFRLGLSFRARRAQAVRSWPR
jgi:hypothetical protein